MIKIGVEAFILNENNDVLFGLRKNCSGNGKWGLAGGHLKFFEFPKKGLLRELNEELGLKNIKAKLKVIYLQFQPKERGGNYIHFGYEVSINTKKERILLREPEKCEKWQFFSLNNIKKSEIFWAHQKEVEAYIKGSKIAI